MCAASSFLVRCFFNNNSGTVASLHRRHSARVSGCGRGWDPSLQSRLRPRGQGRTLRPIRRLITSKPTPPMRARACPSSNQEAHPLRSGLHPEGWELPRLPWACPMRDGQRIARRNRPIRRRVAREEIPPTSGEDSDRRVLSGCLGLPRLVSSDSSGGFFGLDRLSPLASSAFVLAGVRCSIPRPWCCVETVGSSPATGQA